MTTPSWPFSCPAFGATEIDEAAAIIAEASIQRRQWSVKTYVTEIAGVYGEVMLVDREWYATVVVRARGEHPTDVRTLGCFPDRMEAMDAVDLVIDEYQAAET